jgi:hypothetical protein
MEKIKLVCRIMDVLNGGIAWGEPIKVEIEADEETTEQRVAELVNRATYEAITEEELPEDQLFAIGKVARAAGDFGDGICWVDSEGHQGGTSLVIEWHQA